jgi:hypothetical protein
MALNESKTSPISSVEHWMAGLKRSTGSHGVPSRTGWPDTIFAFPDDEEIGPRMLSRIAGNTGLSFQDLG